MRLTGIVRSWRGRVLRIAFGSALFFYGAARPSLFGLVLMMVGVVPVVMGIAGIRLIEEGDYALADALLWWRVAPPGNHRSRRSPHGEGDRVPPPPDGPGGRRLHGIRIGGG
jgi:hypothetical protein